jgi:hypothetical protein
MAEGCMVLSTATVAEIGRDEEIQTDIKRWKERFAELKVQRERNRAERRDLEIVGGGVSLAAVGTEQDVSNAPERSRVWQVESGSSVVGRGSQVEDVRMVDESGSESEQMFGEPLKAASFIPKVDEYYDNAEKENSTSQDKNALSQAPNEHDVQMVNEPGYVKASMVRELLEAVSAKLWAYYYDYPERESSTTQNEHTQPQSSNEQDVLGATGQAESYDETQTNGVQLEPRVRRIVIAGGIAISGGWTKLSEDKEKEYLDSGEALRGQPVDGFSCPAKLAIRLLSWDKPHLRKDLAMETINGPKYLACIRSAVRSFLRDNYPSPEWICKTVFHIPVAGLNMLYVGHKHSNRWGVVENKIFPIKLSKELAQQLASFKPLPPPSEQNPARRRVIIHCVRHAEAESNLSWNHGRQIPDPKLTDDGIIQCAKLQGIFPKMDAISQIFASPLRRTLETTQLGFKPLLDRGLQITPLTEIKELGGIIFNTGSEVSKLKTLFNDLPVAWEEIEGEGKWPIKPKAKSKDSVDRGILAAELTKMALDRIYKSGQTSTVDYHASNPDGNRCRY